MAEIAADAVTEFKEGLAFLRSNYPRRALAHFTRALELDKTNPFYISYTGLAVGAADRNWEAAEELCYQAVKMRRNQPELYLNLAEVYRLAGRRQDAVEALVEGMRFTKQDPRLAAALRSYGYRRPPVLSFFSRDHFLNRGLGKLRSRVLRSLGR
jgi:Flp pilus assembly protein TadD